MQQADKQQPNQQQRVSLSLTAGYARHWGNWEGIRELVQNWYDGILGAAPAGDQELRFFKQKSIYQAETGDGCHLGSVEYVPASEELRMINRRTALSRKVLLLGFSNKA